MESQTTTLPKLIRESILTSPIVGCFLITLGAWIKIPFYPVPMTLQTLAITWIGLTHTPKRALLSTLFYLLLASFRMPVIAGASEGFWLFGKTGGYLLMFPVTAATLAWLKKRISPVLAAFLGQGVLLLFGCIWLALFTDWSTALTHGALYFIPGNICKTLIALTLAYRWRSQ